MASQQFHKAQISILDTLRHSKSASYSNLMRPADMESDAFKFHIRKLRMLGYIEKLPTGHYNLTSIGKEFANNLDPLKPVVQKQPKLSVILIVHRQDDEGRQLYLFQKRLRNPYFDYWGLLSGPAQWQESFEHTAARELHKQTSLTATFTIQSFCRTRDYLLTAEIAVEDKLFIILEAKSISGKLRNNWRGGFNEWMTLEELQRKPKFYATTLDHVKSVQNGTVYSSIEATYPESGY